MQILQRLGADVSAGEGVLDPAVIAEISSQAWPEARDADELHDALLTLIRLSPTLDWQTFFEELRSAGRASTIVRNGQPFWGATERLPAADDANASSPVGWNRLAPSL